MKAKNKDSMKHIGMKLRDPMNDASYEKFDDATGQQIEDLKELVTLLRDQAKKRLPPDIDGKNGDRAAWAEYALVAFESQTGSERESSLGDLLCDLMHWADRNNQDFEAAHARATGHYRIETGIDEDN